MNNYPNNSLILFYPFTRQDEGEEVIIGIPERDLFVILPHDAVELIDYLAAGKTVGEAKSIYQDKYGTVPDLEDLLSGLEQRGFVRPIEDYLIKANAVNRRDKFCPHSYHFANFPQSLAQQIFSIPVLTGGGFVVGIALALAIAEPTIIPTWRAYFFEKNILLMVLTMIVFDWVVMAMLLFYAN